MKTYRMNAVMAGALYLLGTVFGVLSTIVGGDVLSSIVGGKPLVGVDMLGLVAANSAQLNWAAFLILMMGVSLVAKYQQTWQGIVSYSNTFGAGQANPNIDRDFLSVSLEYTY